MLLGIPYLAALLILFGLPLIVASQLAVAAVSWPDLLGRLSGARTARPYDRWAVA